MTILLQGAGPQVITSTPADPIGDTLRADAVAYWKFDEASGTRIDATGRGNNAAETNGSTSAVAGKVGNAAHFVGADGVCLKCAYSLDLVLDSTKDFYAAGWVRFTSKAVDQYILFSEDTVGYNVEYYLTYSSSSDCLIWAYVNELSATTFGSPPLNTWLFVEFFYRINGGKNVGIAINNGAFDTRTANSASNLFNTDTTLFFGDIDYGEYPLFGDVDEWYYSHTIPDQAGRDYLYNSGAGRALFP